ncbi:Uncharacterised protein [Acinetobacter baumannii]|nr:Uncharacterised protein [Acinetobacter baumannii]
MQHYQVFAVNIGYLGSFLQLINYQKDCLELLIVEYRVGLNHHVLNVQHAIAVNEVIAPKVIAAC